MADLERHLRQAGLVGEAAFYAAAGTWARGLDGPEVQGLLARARGPLAARDRAPHLRRELVDRQRADPTGAILPDLHQHLIGRRFRRTTGAFFTPAPVAAAMVRLLGAEHLGRLLDPTCGGGTFLTAAIAAHGSRGATLLGNDVDHTLADLTRLRLALLPDPVPWEVAEEDLYAPGVLARWAGTVDGIVANPPFSLPIEGVALAGPLADAGYRTSDAVFLQVAHRLLRPGGRLVCLLPHGLLANRDHARFRELVGEGFVLRAAIGLPEGVFHVSADTMTRAGIVVLDRRPTPEPDRVVAATCTTVGLALNSHGRGEGSDELAALVEASEVRAALGAGAAAPTATGERPVVHVVAGAQVPPATWDPAALGVGHGGSTVGDHLRASRPHRPRRGTPPSPWAPVEYRHVPGWPHQALALEPRSAGPGDPWPAVPGGTLLFGTMRAYLGNVVVTPDPAWIGGPPDARFAVKAEFAVLEPLDGLVHAWAALLRRPGFLARLPLGGGGTRPRLGLEDLLRVPVDVPTPAALAALDRRLRVLAEQEWRLLAERVALVDDLER